jgi:uncharacterized protein (TIGR02996 family)
MVFSLQEQQLRGAIISRPTDDTPRLIYADWLLEQGESWGTFIAAQIHKNQVEAKRWFHSIGIRAAPHLLAHPSKNLEDFERGFLARYDFPQECPRSLSGEPEFQLIAHLTLNGAQSEQQVVFDLLEKKWLGQWRTVHARGGRSFDALLQSKDSKIFDELSVIGRGPRGMQEPVSMELLRFVGTHTTFWLHFAEGSVSRSEAHVLTLTPRVDSDIFLHNVLPYMKQICSPNERIRIKLFNEKETRLARALKNS